MLSPAEDYTEEAAFVAELLRAAGATRTVLELGSGGGHLASHLAGEFELTLVDLSPEMLEVSRRLNPGSAHHQGDMRTLRLGATFDAVIIHDAITYMVERDDLRAALGTAWGHCRPGGTVVVMPDETAESFEPSTDCGGTDGPDGSGARYLEWTWDPDPSDTHIRTDYAFLLRDAAGEVRTVTETHHHGLFGRDTWVSTLAAIGFEVAIVTERTTEDRRPREIFVARRPD